MENDAVSAALAVLTAGSARPSLRVLSVQYVRAVVAAHGGNKTHAARDLGISRRAIYRWLQRGGA